MGYCYWCYYGWPRPIRDIFDQALGKLGGDDGPLHFGPAHIVWEDENFDSAQRCLDRFEEYGEHLTDQQREVVRWSLEQLLAVPDEFKREPEGYDGENPEDYPPPPEWECERR